MNHLIKPLSAAILAAFAPLFSDRSWAKAQTLAVGALLVVGRRTVASALRVMGLAHERRFTNYHRLLNRDAWPCLAAGRVLLGLILAVLPPDAPLPTDGSQPPLQRPLRDVAHDKPGR